MYSLPTSVVNRISSLDILKSKRFLSFFTPHILSYAIGQRSDKEVVVLEEVEVELDVTEELVVVVTRTGVIEL